MQKIVYNTFLCPANEETCIVAETLFPEIFLGCANEEKFAEEAILASATNVACARKRGKQCFHDNHVSSFAEALIVIGLSGVQFGL